MSDTVLLWRFQPSFQIRVQNFGTMDITFIYKCKIEFQKISEFLRIPLYSEDFEKMDMDMIPHAATEAGILPY